MTDVAEVNRLLGVNLWGASSFRADVRVDFDEFGAVISASLLPSSTPAAIVERAKAEGWGEGYEAATVDMEARSAPPGPCGPVDPTSNPYRAALAEGAG